MKDFNTLRKNLKKDFSNLKKIKVALLGDTSTQFLTQALRGIGFDEGYNLDIWEADFDQVQLQVFDTNSSLYEFAPEIIILFQSSHKLLSKYNKIESKDYTDFAKNELNSIDATYNQISENLSAKIIYYNYAEINDSVFGNQANKLESSFLFQLRKLNYELMLFASANHNFYICDLSTLQNQYGKEKMFHPAVYVNTESVLSLDILPFVAKYTIDLISAIHGKIRKCLILDLDNTMWGGIIGDDGVENIQIGSLGIGKAFTEFQCWIKKLKNRGIILAICSKNNEEIAKKPFTDHPDMVIRLEDIAVFIANWDNKADNIRQIQSILNIGFDSMVFLDDNPFERNIVRENIPEIAVPELPEDPADYLEFVYKMNLFETLSVSNEDQERTKLYQTEALRASTQKKFVNEDEYLQSLNMKCVVESFTKFNIPRVAQLSQRSNQFNLRTIRYTEAELERMSGSEFIFKFAFTLIDKFGDSGLICVVSMIEENKEVLFIENWFMSCRVLKRGMENFVLNTLVEHAKKRKYKSIKGEYISTPKNGMVKDHYVNLGFVSSENYWMLDLDSYENKTAYIELKT